MSSGKATVMTFNGTNWVNVGNAGFSGLVMCGAQVSPSTQLMVSHMSLIRIGEIHKR